MPVAEKGGAKEKVTYLLKLENGIYRDMYPNSYTTIKTSSVNVIINWTTKLLFDCFYGF